MIFEVNNASYSYNKERKILDHVTFSVKENEVLSVLGPNGVGKTTLIKCMLGLLQWDEGTSSFNGKPCSGAGNKDIWKHIGYVPQRKQSGFTYTVEEMITLGRTAHLGMFSLPTEKDKEIVNEVMKMVGIEHYRSKLCSRISGGELQMVLIGRALALQPKLLILDEPESNLDFKNQRLILNLIKDLKKEFHISSILNTHFPEHAMELSDSILLLQRNAPTIFGNVKEVMTEENLQNIFSVNVYMRKVMLEQTPYTCIIPGALI